MTDLHATIARLFEQTPWQDLLLGFAVVLPLCVEEGIIDASQLPIITRQLLHELPPFTDLLAEAPRSYEIEALYQRLGTLADDASQETLYRSELSRLRILQAEEAAEMTAFAAARRSLPRGALDAQLRRARALLVEEP